MTPLLLFLLGCAVTYLGTVSAAFNALMRLSLRIHAERTERDDALGWYLEDPRRLFVPARVLISALTIVAAALLARVTGLTTVGLPILILSIVAIVIACEHLIPLIIVRHDPERVLDVLLPSFDAIARVMKPLTSTLLRMGTVRPKERGNGNGQVSPEPALVESAPAHAAVSEQQEAVQEGQARELLRNLADFRETMVREVMTPRPDIVAIESDATLEQMHTLFREQQYSRLPVFKDTLDNVQGFVFIKDLIHLRPGSPLNSPITTFIRPAHFVPETKRVPDLLKEFQRKRLQSAIVVDEYGGTAGLVTVEDLLEEIVGEIRDEYDVEIERIVDEGGGRYLFSGSAHVEEMANLMKVEIEGHGFETVGGYLLSKLGRVPAVGEHLEIDGLDVEILETEQRRITRVRMRRLEPVPANDQQAEP
ncbi:MAG TPA: hemolysin family protein [Vicinamibacterales bacterium]|nr:hemolysin family protein [Vicinamibacterales bacterium]